MAEAVLYTACVDGVMVDGVAYVIAVPPTGVVEVAWRHPWEVALSSRTELAVIHQGLVACAKRRLRLAQVVTGPFTVGDQDRQLAVTVRRMAASLGAVFVRAEAGDAGRERALFLARRAALGDAPWSRERA